MKALRTILVILLLFYFLNAQIDYSIYKFLDYLQESGLYDIIQSVKYYYGDDVAIEVCDQITHNLNCGEVVRVYMTVGSRPISPKTSFEDLLKEIKASDYFKKEISNIYKGANNENKLLIYIIVSSYDILIQKMEETEILTLTKKLISTKKFITGTQKIVY